MRKATVKNGKGHGRRRVTHQIVSKNRPNAVQYKLKMLPTLARRTKEGEEPDTKTAYARVVEPEICSLQRLAERVAERHPTIRPLTMSYIFASMLEVITEELKRGHQVTFSSNFSFGVSFEGRVDPSAPFDARHLPLMPWVRFSPTFINDLNRDVKISYVEERLPTSVRVDSVEYFHGALRLTGDFKHYEGIAVDFITPEGEEVPCHLSATPKSFSTRPYSKKAYVFPTEKADFSNGTLRLTWIDGGGEEQQLSFDIHPAQ